ncbi:hypothetical protein LTR64_004910 [Lithohypha guttulata]|uniref:uncharacterized protein n=1 Tax=Lithohypha guttulata TaxID=1690604 RepID=UPI002DDEB6EF|nr:hypothetical protein LTR51_005253 [Lithohypha guttulata]
MEDRLRLTPKILAEGFAGPEADSPWARTFEQRGANKQYLKAWRAANKVKQAEAITKSHKPFSFVAPSESLDVTLKGNFVLQKSVLFSNFTDKANQDVQSKDASSVLKVDKGLLVEDSDDFEGADATADEGITDSDEDLDKENVPPSVVDDSDDF